MLHTHARRFAVVLLSCIAGALTPRAALGQCTSGALQTKPLASLERSREAMGLANDAIVRITAASDVVYFDYSSDRMYPPYMWQSRDMRLAMEWPATRLSVQQGSAP